MNKNWTKKELDLLKGTYKNAHKNGIRVLNFPKILLESRTKPQCMWQARRLKLQRVKRQGFGIEWKKILTENEKNYIAGILDGEGYICNNYSNYLIGVAMTHKGVMYWLYKKLGGIIYKRKRTLSKNGITFNKQEYAWRINGFKQVKSFLIVMLPYLKVKRKKALQVIKEINKKSL